MWAFHNIKTLNKMLCVHVYVLKLNSINISHIWYLLIENTLIPVRMVFKSLLIMLTSESDKAKELINEQISKGLSNNVKFWCHPEGHVRSLATFYSHICPCHLLRPLGQGPHRLKYLILKMKIFLSFSGNFLWNVEN